MPTMNHNQICQQNRQPTPLLRLGFAGRVLGHPALRSHSSPRRDDAHLSVGLISLRDILAYLRRVEVGFYRVAADMLPAPPGSPDTRYQHMRRQINECEAELETLAEQVRARGVRLTLHLDHHITLGSTDETAAQRAMAEIETRALLLEQLGSGPEGVMVLHAGSPAHDHSALERFTRRYLALSARARARLVVENTPGGPSLEALFWLHQQCGIPIVFDYLHHLLTPPTQPGARLPLDMALGLALASWPERVRPKVHLSTARSEAHLLPARGEKAARVLPPRPGQHADYIALADLLALLRAARGLPPFDIMLEAKAGDLALLRLRDEVARAAPEFAACFAVSPDNSSLPEPRTTTEGTQIAEVPSSSYPCYAPPPIACQGSSRSTTIAQKSSAR